ncbi:MAG: glycosyltransferase family 4 protein [Proteobacteria bacterium]|nr:glycosyltransferase family 4 protein [Pseudomonadota bacterium]
MTRQLTFLSLTDSKQKQGAFIRMDNITRRLAKTLPTHALNLPGYNEESWKRLGKLGYFSVKEIARLALTLEVARSKANDLYYTWDWPLARDLALLSQFKRIDFVFEVNGFHSYEAELRNYFKKDSLLNRVFVQNTEKIALDKAVKIVAVSEGFKNTIVEQYRIDADRIVVAQNGSDPDLMPCSPPPFDSLDPFVIGWVGTFQPYQGLDVLRRLARRFKERDLGIQFLIIGDGADRPFFERRITEEGLDEHFRFLGYVPWDRIAKALSPAHCCIMLPNMSSVGIEYRKAIGVTQIKAYDYMAMGKPILTYRLGDAYEVIEGNGVGLTCEPDLDDLEQTVFKLMDSDLRILSSNSRKLSEDVYNWDQTVERIKQGIVPLL